MQAEDYAGQTLTLQVLGHGNVGKGKGNSLAKCVAETGAQLHGCDFINCNLFLGELLACSTFHPD